MTTIPIVLLVFLSIFAFLGLVVFIGWIFGLGIAIKGLYEVKKSNEKQIKCPDYVENEDGE